MYGKVKDAEAKMGKGVFWCSEVQGLGRGKVCGEQKPVEMLREGKKSEDARKRMVYTVYEG